MSPDTACDIAILMLAVPCTAILVTALIVALWRAAVAVEDLYIGNRAKFWRRITCTTYLSVVAGLYLYWAIAR